MNFLDLLTMSISNLWRRKLRTCLTILGVIIGTASIVVMLSLGFGLKRSYMQQIESSGSLTTVNVYSGNDFSFGDEDSSSSEKTELTDDIINEIAQIEHVKFVSPILSNNIILKQGIYQANVYVRAMTADALKKMDIPLEYGSIPEDDEDIRFILGNQVIGDFYNSKTDSYPYWDTGELPDVDLTSDFFVIYDTEAYYQSQWGGEDGTIIQPPKKYITGNFSLVSGSITEYNEHSYNVYVNIEAFKKQMKKVFKNKPIPEQPTTKGGKPYSYWIYNEAYVQVDDFNYVTEVQQAISEMGLQAQSNAEYVESTQKQFNTIQMALGGIGSVALFVAAISIANTMMMSIYERTKEIGIIKVLGCSLSNIRSLFLMEAAFIGFIGGFLGLLLSYTLSFVLNKLLGSSFGAYAGMGSEEASVAISYIPPWLSLLALVFAVLVGVIAGFLPAIRAMKLSPLSAIKTE